ncbi:unnamed protein product [Schistosoma rodhaini]|uniref:C2H2-type domain-containing protein n=1 Tax=Schistosoma rodhaini TaxID=6188 RepID=A0AA85F6T8_9TREM|nr:unnamed protein product [Schistosoma rodhaini]
MTQRITSCTVPEVPERICTSSMDALQISPFTDTLSNKIADICRIEHTQFGEVYICSVCNVKCTGKAPFSQHISGSHHRKNCNANTYFCNECNTSLNSSEQYALHCSGSKHMRNTISSDNSIPEQLGVEQQFNKSNNVPYFCIPCGLSCSSKEQLDSHFLGKKHKKQCKKYKPFVSDQLSGYVSNEQSDQPIGQPDFFSPIPTLFNTASDNSTNFWFPKMVPCIKNIIELESKLTLTNNFPPFLASVTPCSYQERTDLKSDLSLNQKDNRDSSEPRQFCRHGECILIRSLQTGTISDWDHSDGITSRSQIIPKTSVNLADSTGTPSLRISVVSLSGPAALTRVRFPIAFSTV